MDLTLVRWDKAKDGIFGRIPELKLVTLEHAYGINGDEEWLSKIVAGIYLCKRGWHKLKSGWQGWTYQVMDVSGHDGILFHPGNKEDDSEGCILVGMSVVKMSYETRWVSQSRRAFGVFMRAQAGAEQFTLTVVDP